MALSNFIRIPKHWQSKPSYRLAPSAACRIGQQLAQLAPREETGVKLITREEEALAMRIALIEQADLSLDMQYYKWLDDNSGALLMSHVIAAAERGVRVRLLIDDIHFDADLNAQALDLHPNIEVRLFNPFESRRMTPLTRPFEWLRNSRVNHRMHNKLILADSITALTGGRNIADSYFGLSDRLNFLDLDLLVLGELIDQMSQAFDDFWNSRWAVPVSKLLTVRLPQRQRRRLQLMLRRFKRSRRYGSVAKLQKMATLPAPSFMSDLIWAPAQLIYDTPAKVTGESQSGSHAVRLIDQLYEVSQSVYMMTPYLIPTQGMLKLLNVWNRRGVNVHIQTNSLASNDVIMAHGGYSHYRKAMLKAGAYLYELSPTLGSPVSNLIPYSLHSKSLVLDKQLVFLGTHNADPRSLHLNTEMGLLIQSPELARQLITIFTQQASAPQSWRVHCRFNRLFWRRKHQGHTELKRQEPESGIWRRLLACISALLPVHHQL